MKTISFRNDILPLKNVLYRLALRITLNHEDSEDVVQDTLMKLWNRRNYWDEIENIEAFALTICRNLALDKVKRAATNNISIDEGQVAELMQAPNPLEQITQRDRVSMVRQLLDSLPEKQRSCMHLRDFEGKSYKEIAEILQVSEEQVKVNIHRARQMIKQKFKEAEEYGL